MKPNVFSVMPLCGLLVGTLVMPGLAIEAHDLILRNGLNQSVVFEVNENVLEPKTETYDIQPRWEVQVKKVKVDLSDPKALSVRLNKADSGYGSLPNYLYDLFRQPGRRRHHFPNGGDTLQCDTVDLHNAPTEAAASFQQSVTLSRLALGNQTPAACPLCYPELKEKINVTFFVPTASNHH